MKSLTRCALLLLLLPACVGDDSTQGDLADSADAPELVFTFSAGQYVSCPAPGEGTKKDSIAGETVAPEQFRWANETPIRGDVVGVMKSRGFMTDVDDKTQTFGFTTEWDIFDGDEILFSAKAHGRAQLAPSGDLSGKRVAWFEEGTITHSVYPEFVGGEFTTAGLVPAFSEASPCVPMSPKSTLEGYKIIRPKR
jgi:hypothetical protein